MKRHVTAALLALSIPFNAAAQEPVRLTLQDAIARGFEASHRIAELGARQAAAQAIVGEREAASMPQVSLLAGYARTNHVDVFRVLGGGVIYPDIPDNYRSRVDLQWPIYTGGRTEALTRAAEAEVNATGQDREAARADLRLEITRVLYWAVITARAAASVVREALDRMNAHLGDVRNLLSVGLVPPNDVLSAEAQQANQQLLLIQAENLSTTSAIDFRRLVGLAPEAPFELVDQIEAPVATSSEVTALLATARANRPERKALEIRVQGFDERITAARAQVRPTIALAGGSDVARPNPKIFPRQGVWKPSWDAGVNFSWSLFDGGRVHAETAEATANRLAAKERLNDFDASLDAEVRQRAADLEAAEAAISAADAGVRSATEARRVITERFASGVETNTDVIDAQLVLLQAELDRTRALASVRLALARLERALGR